MAEAFGDFDVEARRSWTHHSRRYLPDVWPQRKRLVMLIKCCGQMHMEIMWTVTAILHAVFCLCSCHLCLSIKNTVNRFISPLLLCSYFQQVTNGNARDIQYVFLYFAHTIRKSFFNFLRQKEASRVDLFSCS